VNGEPDPAVAVSSAGTTRWLMEEPGVRAWGVWTEKIPECGEDAEPLLEHHRPTWRGVVGVFDGAGGAGHAAADADRFGRKVTSAWVASRVAALATREWFRGIVSRPGPVHRAEVEELEDRIGDALKLMRPKERTRLVGSMVRSMPTTMAAATYELVGGEVEARVLWAGDSRVYALDPVEGLRALTRDHTEEQDALEQLRQDPPMENILNSSNDWRLHSARVRLPRQCLLVCATDGFFGYVEAPHLFEQLLLESLEAVTRQEELSGELERAVRSYTGDDASLAVVAFGFEDFGEMRDGFRDRLHTLHREFDPPPREVDQETYRAWQEASWRRYRPAYEALMPSEREWAE
jgi:serine/threonine protein phosphatase PrpC